MPEWLEDYRGLLVWAAIASVVLFALSAILIPAAIVRIPADYFAHEKRPASTWATRHPIVRFAHSVGKNVIGVALVLAGIAMLALPGQGLLTILVGIFLLDFPGKYRLEKWFVSRRGVLSTINWMRRKAGCDPITTRDEPKP